MNYINRSSLDSLRIYRSKKMIEAQKRERENQQRLQSENSFDEKLAKEIISVVCAARSVTYEDMQKITRNEHVRVSRQICIYLIKNMTKLTDGKIGLKFNQHHSTVSHTAIKAIPSWLIQHDFSIEFKKIEKEANQRKETLKTSLTL